MSHWWDLCEDLRDDESKGEDHRHDRDCDRDDSGHERGKRRHNRHCRDCAVCRRRRKRFIPIGQVTIDCTPVIFRTNQCPCPWF